MYDISAILFPHFSGFWSLLNVIRYPQYSPVVDDITIYNVVVSDRNSFLLKMPGSGSLQTMVWLYFYHLHIVLS